MEPETTEDIVIEIHQSETVGREALAARDIAAGELISRESPIAWSLDHAVRSTYCDACARPLAEVEPAGGCEACGVRYCSSRCELMSAVVHSMQCDALQSMARISDATGVGVDLLRLALAVCVGERFSQTPLAEDAVLADRAEIDQLEAPLDRYPRSVRVRIEAAAKLVSQAASGAFKPGEIERACARVSSNSFQLAKGDDPAERIGHALGPRTALYNHSCFPNAAMSNAGALLEVRARRPIAAGEPVTLTYVGLYSTRSARRATLLHQRFFECVCTRCTGAGDSPVDQAAFAADRNLSGARCERPGCPGLIGPPGQATRACDTCAAEYGGPATDARIETVTAALKAALTQAQDGESEIAARRKIIEGALTAAEAVLPGEHAAIFESLPALILLLGEQGDYGERVARARQLVGCVARVLPKFSVSAETCYLLLAESLLYFDAAYAPPPAAKQKLAEEVVWALTRRAEIFAACCGKDHEATRNAVQVLSTIEAQFQPDPVEPTEPTEA